MKKNHHEHHNFSPRLFVSTAIAALILLPLLAIFLKSLAASLYQPMPRNKYYLKTTENSDPLVTQAPTLKNLLAGPIISSSDPSLGNPNAKVTIIQFSDFTCSYCQKQEKILKQILADYKNKVRFIWKDYPNNDPNSISWQAALAGRCALAQNLFWPYHDLLYQNTDLNKQKLIDLAGSAKLNSTIFKNCLDDAAPRQLVRNNIEEADALEISGVPFLYVNDQEVVGAATYDDLKRIIEVELNK